VAAAADVGSGHQSAENGHESGVSIEKASKIIGSEKRIIRKSEISGAALWRARRHRRLKISESGVAKIGVMKNK
jgi:hypothetical protein